MKTIANLLTSVTIAFWVIAIAIVSVQNFTPVSVRFLNFQSIQIPFGIVLALCAACGMMSIGILQPLWGISRAGMGRKASQDDDAEFFVDEDF